MARAEYDRNVRKSAWLYDCQFCINVYYWRVFKITRIGKTFKTKIGVDADAQYTRNDGLGSVESEHRLGVLQSACYSNRSAYSPSL